jgi:hypothetical protein
MGVLCHHSSRGAVIELCWLLGISVLKEEGNEFCGKPCPFCGERGKEVRRAHHQCTLVGPLLEWIYQTGCLCEAEKRMIHRIENVKAVEGCDVTKEVASTDIQKRKGSGVSLTAADRERSWPERCVEAHERVNVMTSGADSDTIVISSTCGRREWSPGDRGALCLTLERG